MSGLRTGEAFRLATRLLDAAGLTTQAAEQTARALVLADSWGVGSHGLMRLPFYLERLAAGGCRADAALRTVTDTGSLVVFDGEDGLGHWQLWRAAELARDRCADTGVAIAAVGRSSHCGSLGVYTIPALEAGLFALVFSNGPAVMPPVGGFQAVVSTSPIAAGIPCRPRPAIVDLATSAVARGKIKAAAGRGDQLEPGWAFAADGRPTTDAEEALAGMLAPLGGPKGFALAFLVEALTGGMVGPALSTEVSDMFDSAEAARPQRIAHLVITVDPARLNSNGEGEGESAAQRLDQLAAAVTGAGGRVPGSRRILPAELDDAAELGVASAVEAELREWAGRLSVSPAG